MALKQDFKDQIPQNGKRLYGLVDGSGSYIYRDLQIVRTNANTQEGDAYGAQQVNEERKLLNQLSNPNLLINGDFQVWQRGTYFGFNQQISSSSMQSYTADRWRLFADTTKKAFKASIQQVKNGIEINIMSGADISAFTQMMGLTHALVKEINGKKIAVSFKIYNPGAEFTIHPCISIVNSSGSYNDYKSTVLVKTGTNVYSAIIQLPSNIEYYETYPYLRFNLWNVQDVIPLSKFEIFYIKVEIGDYSTPYVPRSYALENDMCQMYFQFYRSLMLAPIEPSSKVFIGFPLRSKMRVIPSYNVTSLYNDYGTDIIGNITNLLLNEYGLKYIQLSKTNAMIELSISFDAEIYS